MLAVTPEVDANTTIIEAWNGVLFDKFCRYKHLLTAGLAQHGDEALARHPPLRGANVLDIGCGFGDTTLEIACRVGPSGACTGVDAAPRFIEAAREALAESGLTNAAFAVADVQADALGGPFEHAFSRFGTMFFLAPVAAFRNVRRSLRQHARLVMVVWRRKEDNPALCEAEAVVRGLVNEPEHSDEPTCGPGPFALAGADTVCSILTAAGFDHISLERFDADVCIGADIDEAIEFAMNLGPAGEIMRLAGAEAERQRPHVISALRELVSRYATPAGVLAPSSTWIVSARAA